MNREKKSGKIHIKPHSIKYACIYIQIHYMYSSTQSNLHGNAQYSPSSNNFLRGGLHLYHGAKLDSNNEWVENEDNSIKLLPEF